MADNLLDKASILLTPTAYNDGRMLSVKPNENLYGSELVTNGDFGTDSDWTKGTGWSIGEDKASRTAQSGSTSMYQSVSFTANKSYKITYDLDISAGSFLLRIGGGALIDTTPRTTSGTYTEYIVANSGNNVLNLRAVDGNFIGSIDNVSVVEDLSGDFTFSRSSAATRVNAQGLVENVQIISSELVSNGNFSQIGTEEVSNGNFSQEGSELVTNGDFATDSDWILANGAVINNGSVNIIGVASSFRQDVLTSGKSYRLDYQVVSTNGASFRFQDGVTSYTDINQTVGYHTYYFKATGTRVQFQALGNIDARIDNVSVKEVGQDWSLETRWSIGDGSLVANSVTTGLAFQSNIVEANKSYKATYSVVVTSGSVGLYFDGGTGYQGVVTTTQTITVFFKATTTSPLYFRSNTSNFTGSITNISVKEVGQDWTFGTGWSVDQANSKAIHSGTVAGNITQNAFTSGKSYKVKWTQTNGKFISVYGDGLSSLISNSDVNKDYTVYFNSVSGGNISFRTNVDGAEVSNISVKEITDDTDLPRINYEGFSYQDSLGSELVVNGGFDTDSNWNKTQATISNGEANISSDGSYTAIDQSNVSVIGKNYFYSINVKSITGTMQFRLGSGTDVDITTIGIKTGYIVATSTTLEIKRKSGAGAINATIDNISVKEVLGQEVVPDSGCGSWLLEPQSTNLITQSELFSDASWLKLGASVSNGFTSPDGTDNAYKIIENTSNGTHRISNSGSFVSGVTYTFSCFAKKGERDFIHIAASSSTTFGINSYFDLANGVVGTNSSGTASIENYGNGWYRCSIVGISSNTGGTGISIYSAITDNSNSYQGDGTSGVYIWGAQLEQQSYATSYIPTNGATNTRLQDIANNSGNSTLISSTEGVLYAEIAALSSPVDSPKNITISDGTVNNYVRIEYYQDGRVYGNVYDGTSVAANFVVNQLNFNKVAIQYSSSGSKLYVNGTGVDFASKIFTSNTLNTIQFSSAAADSNYFYGKNKALAVYKEALTDANLRSLTYPNPVATTFDLDFDTIAEQFTFTRGSEATFVNAQGLIESTASNDAPRIDYSTGAKAFLLEPQSTNLITQSELFSDASWGKQATIVDANSIISADGTQNASKIQSTQTGSALVSVSYPTLTVGNTYTFSCFAKKGNNDWIRLAHISSGGTGCWFDLENGVVGTVNSQSATIEDYGNGWYKCTNTFIATASTHANLVFIGICDADGSTNAGIVGQNDYLWGAQLEQQSYATSYIPTDGASATRNQELCNNATPVINSEEGTLYAEISALADDLTNRYLGLSAQNIINNRIAIGFTSAGANRIRLLMTSGIGNYVDISYTVSNITSNTKIAISYKLNDVSLWVNGLKVGADTSAVMPSGLSELNFDSGTGGSPFFGNTKGLKYYPKALADVQLEDLTTI